MLGLARAIEEILRPLVRLALSRGLTFGPFAALLRRQFILEGSALLQRRDEKVTDSRLSLLTGLQRREVKALRAEPAASPENQGTGPFARMIATWQADPCFHDQDGKPAVLAKTAAGRQPSFEALAQSVTKDIHPRTLLDESLRRGLVTERQGGFALAAAAFIPEPADDQSLAYFGKNVGDHARAAVSNLVETDQTPPFFERAVYYNRLSQSALEELEHLARHEQQAVLERINAAALKLQRQSAGDPEAQGRFRCGAFIYVASRDAQSRREDDE